MPFAQPRAMPVSGPEPEVDTQVLLAEARRLGENGHTEEAFAAYIALLQRLPNDLSALHGLGRLAYRTGRLSAAKSIYEQLVTHWPLDVTGRVNLGCLLYESSDLDGAEAQFQAALALDGALSDPHRGLARIAQDRGDDEKAQTHWRKSFPGQAAATQPFRGTTEPAPLLMLVSTKGGNIPTQHILDDRIHATTALYVDYYRPDLPLPPHGLILNAIGDADRCGTALAIAAAIVARSGKPVINPPARVRETGRAANAERLGQLPGVRTPKTQVLRRDHIAALSAQDFPLLLRAPGFHTGQHFVRVETQEDLDEAAAALPGEELLVIEYLDARGADGLARKYRVMIIDGLFYPLHLAVSADWKVHYFSADMLASHSCRAEEQCFLEDMPAVLGDRAMTALAQIAQSLGLDYAGVDFALDADGTLLLFEANATMLINPPGPERVWDYRRAAAARALAAAQKLLEA
jgi:glutathione synthase/RimK-type ligase-like ATP-grasp enzyme